MTRKVRWGILSTSKFAVEKIIPAMRNCQSAEVVAITSRDGDKAKAAAHRLGIPVWHGSYEELLADPDVDVIYNPLPNHLHVPWSIRALEAGKHVLCEKPIGLSAAEGAELVLAGRRFPKLKLMEAFMYRHHPQWQTAKRIVRDGGIGTLRTIQTFFSYFNDDAANIRNIADIGGGAMLDIGCYAVSLSRFLFDAEPRRVFGTIDFDPRFQTDRLASAILEFDGGTSTFTCSTQTAPYQRVHIIGTAGRLEIEIPFNAPNDQPCRVFHQNGDRIETLTIPTCDQYTIQGDLFSQAILNDTAVPTPIEDAVRNMDVIEAVFRSHREGGWSEVQPTAI